MFLLHFTLRHRERPDHLNQPLGGPKLTPKRRPGAARHARGGPQDGSKSATSVPRAPQGLQTRLLSGLGGQVGPNCHKRAARRPSKGHFGPPRGPVLHPPGGRSSDSFLLSESIAKAVLWAKLVQAYAQHRFTSLCSFYMWISTATDSKSIDR